MGVVYRAADTHLNRSVAVKVLHADAIRSAEKKWRFAQEAKAASALNHPNIVHVYDVDAQDGVDYIAMEFVAGRTLGQCIERKGLSLRDALKFAVQIADALSAAHAAGIVHRDLKPANVIVTDHGLVKLLDFGLAKLADPSERDPNAPTATIRLDETPRTEEGTIVGTVAYMSPEQAEARKVDARTDIFSFGSLLYEIVTGRRAFQGATRMATLSAILEREPQAVSAIAPHIPAELERIIGRCLRKNIERRFQNMADVKVALLELQEESESGKLARPRVEQPKRARTWALASTGVLVAVTAAAIAWKLARNPQSTGSEAMVLTQLTADAGLTIDPAISPDGKLVAYASDRSGEGNLEIWVQQVNGRQASRLTQHSADDHEPAFSPDGAQIAFRSERDGGGIYVVSTFGGDARLVAPSGRRPRFSPDGSRIAYWVGNIGGDPSVPGTSKMFVIETSTAAPASTPQQIAADFAAVRYPVWSPDGKALLFWGIRTSKEGIVADGDWWVAPLDGGPPVQTGADAVLNKAGLQRPPGWYMIAPTDYVGDRVLFSALLGDSTNLWELTLAPGRFTVTRAPRRFTAGSGLETQPSAAAGGIVVFASLLDRLDAWALPVDTDNAKIRGEMVRLTHSADAIRSPRISDDGKLLAYVMGRAMRSEVRLRDLVGSRDILLGGTMRDGLGPAIAPDGSKVVYPVKEGPVESVYAVSASGGVPQRLCTDCRSADGFSPDGKKMIFWAGAPGPASVGVLDLASGQKQIILKRPGYAVYRPRFSRDGHWLTFHARNRPGRSAIFVAPFRGRELIPEQDWIAVTDGESYDIGPFWSPNGAVLYFISERDGFRCLWAQRLDPATKHPAGAPFAMRHFHAATQSMMHLTTNWLGLSVTTDKLVFNVGDITGNVWLAKSSTPPQR
jgi:serine/threonine protein kinase/Tol biopolymer transport system component